MRALVISDIHANLDALDAVLDRAPEHDVVWNLGDVVGYGALPNETVDRVRGLASVSVRGNHDRACTGQLSLAGFNPIAARAAEWTERTLTPDRIVWLRQMAKGPVQVAIEDAPASEDDKEVSCMHGSNLDEDEYLLSAADAVIPLRTLATGINFFGHTHRQGAFAASGQDWFDLVPEYSNREEAEVWELPLRSEARYLINPGSVGQPRDGDWRAAFGLYDSVRGVMEFHRAPYDVKRAQMRILAAHLPDRLASRLSQGR